MEKISIDDVSGLFGKVHEFLLKIKKAGGDFEHLQKVIDSKDNQLSKFRYILHSLEPKK